jgi:hypothetical protein
VNEGQRQRTGSLSLQVKSGASTVGAASSRTSSRHIYISYIEFILLIHVINSYTKFIVLIHIINSLQAASTCLSRIKRGKGSLGGMPFSLSVWNLNECNILSMNMNNIYELHIWFQYIKIMKYEIWIHVMKYVYELITWWNRNMK